MIPVSPGPIATSAMTTNPSEVAAPTDDVTLAALEELARVAADIADVEAAGVIVVDLTTVRTVAIVGAPLGTMPRTGAFAGLVADADAEIELLVTSDDPSLGDDSFADGPAASLSWYAGIPLHVNGSLVGTLSVADHVKHELSQRQWQMLRLLARQAEALWTLSLRCQELPPPVPVSEMVAQLQAERDQSTALLGALREGYVYTVDNVVVQVNDALCELTGFSRDELVGTAPPYPVWPQDYIESNAERGRNVLSDGGGSVEVVWQRKDGSRFDAALSAHPVVNREGETNGFITLVTDISIRKDEERRLRHRADHDGLTGLLNQSASHHSIRAHIAASRAVNDGFCLAIIDLDRFKLVNDTYGHAAGDAVLVELAARLRRHARLADRIGRIGGEEFVWLMPQTGLREATAAVERVARSVREEPFPLVGPVTFSAGVAELALDDTTESLLRRADVQLYAAKSLGRDRVHAVPPAQRQDA